MSRTGFSAIQSCIDEWDNVQVAPWEMMEEEKGAQQQQNHGGWVQPVSIADMVEDPQATIHQGTSGSNNMHSPGHSVKADGCCQGPEHVIGAACPLLHISLLSTTAAVRCGFSPPQQWHHPHVHILHTLKFLISTVFEVSNPDNAALCHVVRKIKLQGGPTYSTADGTCVEFPNVCCCLFIFLLSFLPFCRKASSCFAFTVGSHE